jgi:hypothetical protein
VNIPAKLRDRFHRSNAEAAAIILSAPEAHTGAALEWARLFVVRTNADKRPSSEFPMIESCSVAGSGASYQQATSNIGDAA